MTDGLQEIGRSVAILNVSPVHHEADHQAKRVDDDMTLRPLIFFPASKPRMPRFRWF